MQVFCHRLRGRAVGGHGKLSGGEHRRGGGQQHGCACDEHGLELGFGIEGVAGGNNEIRQLSVFERADAGVDAEQRRRGGCECGERLVLGQSVGDRIAEALAERTLVLHAVGCECDGGAGGDEALGVGGGVAPRHQVAQRNRVGGGRRDEVGRLRELERHEQRDFLGGEKLDELGLRAELVAISQD